MEYLTLKSLFNRIFLRDLNQNFEDIDRDITTISTKQVNNEQRLTTSLNQSYAASLAATAAETKANDAKVISLNAENTANNVVTQFNEVVLSGSIDPETAQARIGYTGQTYDTLKAHLDAIELYLRDFAINVKQFPYNAKGDGDKDDTDAIKRAEADVFALGGNYILHIPYGDYKTTDKITFRCALSAEGATFRYYGTGLAVVAGDDSIIGRVTSRRTYRLPRVINMSRGINGWDGTSTGIKLINLNGCDVYVPHIQDFENGLTLYGWGQGAAYNNIYLRHLWENHKNLVIENDEVGWANQNQFFGGRLQHSLTKGAVLNDPEASQIYMGTTNHGGPNNNTFYSTSLEGENIALHRVTIAGTYNHFNNCRWEGQNGSNPVIRYKAGSYSNRVNGGYNAHNIVEIFEGTEGGGDIWDSYGAYIAANNTSGQLIPSGVWTPINTWTSPIGRRITYTEATGEFTPRPGRWRIIASVSFAPNTTGRRMAKILAAGINLAHAEVPPSTSRHIMKMEDVYRFNGQTAFRVECYQSSGADLALETTSPYVRIQAEYLGT